MEIIELFIEKHKKFENLDLVFSDKNIQEQDLVKYFFPEINIQALIGVNGSGKTTVLSFICIIFRYLERNQERIPCAFRIVYRLKSNIVTISKNNENIFIAIDDSTPKLLLEYNVQKKKYLRKPSQLLLANEDTTIVDVVDYLPSNCIAISVDIDYPENYNTNLIKNVDLYTMIDNKYFQDIGITGKNVSYGAFRFICKTFNEKFTLIKHLGFEFSGYVQLYFNFDSEYNDSGFEEIKNLLSNANTLNSDIILSQIISQSFFKKFIHTIEDNTPGIGFNIIDYLRSSDLGYAILDILIRHNLIYINDIYFLKDKHLYGFKNMSTGEKNLIGPLIFVLTHIEQDSLIIIEEPELHLNDIWVSKLIDLYVLYFTGYNTQFIISSHRYSLINKLFRSQLLLCGNDISKPDFNTFLATSDNIINYLDPSEQQFDSVIKNKMQQLIDSNDTQMLKHLFDSMGESFERYTLFSYLKGIGVIDVESN